MKAKNCLIFGGSGQIGRNLITKLTKNNYQVTVVTRNIHQKSYIIKTQANAGYINIIESNIFDESKIKDANLKKRQIYWIDDISIHQLLESCMAVFTVNSGVGLEAILHRKKVFTFGNADYSSISTKIIFGGSLGNAVQAINHNIKDFLLYFDEQQYASSCTKFIHSWYNCHADCENPSSFIKFLP